MLRIKQQEALTFDDILLVPAYSEILPSSVSLQTKLTKKITLNIPIISASMDTVTESKLAIALASIGGLGIIHKNMTEEKQILEVLKVKNTKVLEGWQNSVLDVHGKLLVGAAVGIDSNTERRVKSLIEAGVDIISIDSSHGHSKGVLEKIKLIKKSFPNIQLIGGNVATAKGAKALIEAGVDAVKVGIGPGSICTTRIVTGVGVPQITAISDTVEIANKFNIPVIADGGIRYSGDIGKAIAAGASSVMLGSLLAGTDEAPGEVEEINGKKYKSYRGMGSIGAMQQKYGSADRYFQNSTDKLVPEGVEAKISYKGSVLDIVFQQIGGLRSCMGLTGCGTIEKLRTIAEFVKVTSMSTKESHVHDLEMIKETSNYKIRK
ncbi:MAG: IMP dehydrogenase [Psittacicella sp.]